MADRLLVHEAVAAQAARRPDALAVSAADGCLSYAELDERASRLARRLRAAGVGREDLVALCLQRSAALVVGALGILKAGAAYVALDPANPAGRLQFMLSDSGAAVVVTSTDLAAKVGQQTTRVTLDAGGQSPADVPAVLPETKNVINDLAYVVYTSGSTGQPKGVLIEHGSLLNLVAWHTRAFELSEDDRGTQIASPGFDAVVWELWPLLTSGAAVHIPPEQLRTDPASLRDWLVESGVTITFLPTALAEALLALAWPATTALRYLLTGGDALRRHPRADIPFTLVNNYGPAEATVVATSGIVPPLVDGVAEATPPTIGAPIDAVTVHVVDDRLQPVDVGAVGELLVGGAGVARGYLNRPELTAEKFVVDPSEPDARRLYRTGDLVRSRADGELEFVGRVDEQVQIAGRRIELGEITAALDRQPSVHRSVVIATGSDAGKRLVAFAVPSLADRPQAQTLRDSLAAGLPDYMIPADIIWLTELPMSVSDKVDRAALEQLVSVASPADHVAPRNELEETLVAIVAELLGLEAVGTDENFFLLGGHSLLGAQVIARIEDGFGVEMPLRDLFDRPTVAEMAEEVERLIIAELEAMTDEEAERLTPALQASPTEAGH